MPKTKDYIYSGVKKGKMHFSLIDPDPTKVFPETIGETALKLQSYGTSAIMIGGSTGIKPKFLDDVIKGIKSSVSIPVILFPGGSSGVSRFADAIFFMSLMNSKDPFWITGIQSETAPIILDSELEPISMAYLITEPGMKVGEVGKADILMKNDFVKATGYALAAQTFGMSLVYLEAGSGSSKTVPLDMINRVKRSIEIPLIVGGGIKNSQDADSTLSAGADIIVTGTAIESDFSKMKSIIETVKRFKK